MFGATFLLIPAAMALVILMAAGVQLPLVQAGLLVLAAVVILRWPFTGIVATAASMPIVDVLPPVSYATSLVPVIGGLTLLGFIVQALQHKVKGQRVIPSGLVFGALLVAWILVTNPAAALQAGIEGRVWLLTYVQLLVMAYLASVLLENEREHRYVMWGFAVAAVVSAVHAIQNGSIGNNVHESVRSAGLAAGANGAARYYLVALAFMYFLRAQQKGWVIRALLLPAMGILVWGLMATVSRSGLLLLVALVGLLLISRPRRIKPTQVLALLGITTLVVWAFADNIVSIVQSIVPAIRQGTDTVGVRYGLWEAGIRMWLSNPIGGVGIGQYTMRLPQYGWDLLNSYYWSEGAHNMYVQILAETGLVGLCLFLLVLGSAVAALLKAATSAAVSDRETAQAWLVALVLMLLGGITKHDQYDKLIWLAIGVAMSLTTGALPKIRVTAKRRPAVAGGQTANLEQG